jgi:hypothetical protein
MPKDEIVTLQRDQYTLLTDADVPALTFQVLETFNVELVGAVGVAQPAAAVIGNTFVPGEGRTNVALSDLFPGIAGVNRVYGISRSGTGKVRVSYA